MLEGFLICVCLYTVVVFLVGGAITAGLLVFHVAVVPLVFRYSKTFRRSLIFANFVQWPLYIDHEDPASSGIEGARNLSIEYHSKIDSCPIRIGIWHILPKTAYERLKGQFTEGANKEQLNRLMDDELANSGSPIMMYCHGNSNSRAAAHRIQLYKFFQQMEFHTIAFDYRGYGDSTNIPPSENGVVEDSLMVYEWLRNTIEAGSNPSVFVWGHSLGTGISSHLLGNLPELSKVLLERPALPLPDGLILEAPFNNIADEVAHHPLSKLVTWLPYYRQTFISQFVCRPEHCFRSDEHLTHAPALPVLILHARDDVIVPHVVGAKDCSSTGSTLDILISLHLSTYMDDVIVPHVVGAKLYEAIRQSRSDKDAPVTLHSYDKSERLGHKWICNAKDLPEVIGKFVSTHRSPK